MLKQFVFSKTFLSLVTASLLAEVAITIWNIPSQAATLSFSQISTQLNNFSHQPDRTQTFTDTKTLAISSPNSSSFAIAQAEADFFVEPTLATNSILSSVIGKGSNFFGSAQSEAQVIGSFTIKPSDVLSFDFFASADSFTWKDDAKEVVNTSGELSLLIVDTINQNIIYDSFSMKFDTQTSSATNSLNLQNSPNFSIKHRYLSNNFTQSESSSINTISASVTASFNYQFETATTIALKEYKKNQVTVQVPEAETLLGSICFLVLTGIKYKNKKAISI